MNITFIGSGRYSDVFRIQDGRHTVIMKLSYYRDNTMAEFAKELRAGHADTAKHVKNRDSIMVSNAFSSMTNALVNGYKSPHFVYIYCSSDCQNMPQKLAPLIPSRMKTSTSTQLKYNNICFMEQFSSDMTKWLRGRSKTLTDTNVCQAIFGVLYTLALLQHKYPGFRHNDLSTNNVLVKRTTKPQTIGYAINGSKFLVTTPTIVALSDYDFTHVPNHKSLQNERVVSGKYKVTQTPNPTYDTHFFLKTVLRNMQGKTKQLPKTISFLKSLPFKSDDRLDLQRVPGMEPHVLIKHAYFKPLQVRQFPQSVDVYSAS
jgi:hypothetical protein